MSLTLADPQQTIDQITTFIADTFHNQHLSRAVIAVSGGIDSAVSLALTTRALGVASVIPVLLPVGEQSMTDARAVIQSVAIPEAQIIEHNVQLVIQALHTTLGEVDDPVRRGNLMARSRMIVVYDIAKAEHALVVGTENKSEKYLGYFTRFSDEASVVEPIQHLYKTQVRQLAALLAVPTQIITKAPSAGLWQDQTDEQELGFSYAEADRVMKQLVDHAVPESELAGTLPEINPEIIRRVVERVHSQAFKQQVPYRLSS